VGLIGRAFSGFINLAILFAISIALAGAAVTVQLASNGGWSFGGGLGASTTFVRSMASGWRDYAAAEANANANDAEKRAAAAEKRAKAAEQKAKKAQGKS
jgi:hypothetical protein